MIDKEVEGILKAANNGVGSESAIIEALYCWSYETKNTNSE